MQPHTREVVDRHEEAEAGDSPVDGEVGVPQHHPDSLTRQVPTEATGREDSLVCLCSLGIFVIYYYFDFAYDHRQYYVIVGERKRNNIEMIMPCKCVRKHPQISVQSIK